MMAQEQESETLGQKHRDYNATVQDSISSNSSSKIARIHDDHYDIDNLLRIDVACHKRDVDYILDVIKGEDMLYLSRALSQSIWLITDQEYAHIINPEYLETNVFPDLNPKAATKFKKHIRHNIKDETRAEQFYLNEKNKSDALKWLPYCSVKFIESKILCHMKSSDIQLRLFKRLCEKSVSIFEIMLTNLHHYEMQRYLQVVTFLLNTDADKYLDVLEKNHSYFGYYSNLNHKATELIMKHSPNRITDKIEIYVSFIHIPTFVKHLTADQIKTFLYAQAKKDLENDDYMNLRKLFNFDTLKLFIRRLPKSEQFDFVKTVCMGKEIEQSDEVILSSDSVPIRMMKLCHKSNPKPYIWYEFAPFEQAFEEITKMYPLSANNYEKREMLTVLVKCANHNLQHIQDILKYYIKQTKEDSDGKCQFVTKVLEHTHISQYDEKTWDILNKLLISAKIYKSTDLSDRYKQIVHSIIIYNVLNGQNMPEIIEKRFSFDTLKSYKTKIDQEQQNKIFGYLYNYLVSTLNDPVINEKDLKKSIKTLENILKLMQDWSKSFQEFPLILNKIRECIELKKDNSWKTNLSSLYNVNKSWRKHMFEESLALSPSEEVCLNALKHEPQLLARHSDEVDALRTNDSVSLRRVQRKLRTYWPRSLAQQWIHVYMNNIKKTDGQKAAVQGLCIMLAPKTLLGLIADYNPSLINIKVLQIEDHVLNVQRLLAKHMHIARPQPVPNAILSFAKGDYLQFALPSLLAIFYNLKPEVNKIMIPKLLDAPVSLQKHGIRLAFQKLDREELKKVFLDCWKSSKSVSIRAIIFKYTFTLLCSEKDDANVVSLWELFELFIDNLTFAEDKDIYKLLGEVDKVPLKVRGKYIIKCYKFLQKLIPHVDESNRSNYQWLCTQLAEHSREVMETISPDFVINIIQEFIEHDFLNCESKFVRAVHHCDGIIGVISAYLLCTTNESAQIQKYEQVIMPLMQRSFEKWDEKRLGQFFIRKHFQHLLTRLSIDLKTYVTKNKKIIPLKMFSLMQIELEKSLKVSENYLMLTRWKLTVALATLAKQYSSTEDLWYEKCGPEFGKICLEYLKNDVSAHFSCIYVLFSKSVRSIMDDNILPPDTVLQFYESIISDKDFIQGYLAAIEISADRRDNDGYKDMYKQIFAHPSVEVKMHYYNKIEKPLLY